MFAIEELVRRFPALRRVGITGGRRIPYVETGQFADCGPACLTMVFGYHGLELPLERVRQDCGVSRHGSSATALLEAARNQGLLARGVKLSDLDQLRYLPPASILHWAFTHFVVLESFDGETAVIVDPARGRVRVGREQLDRAFTGVALTFEPTAQFSRSAGESGKLLRYFRALLGDREVVKQVLVVSLALQVFALGLPLLTGVLVDRVIPRADHDLLWVLLAGVLLLVGFRFVCSLLRGHLLLHLRTRLDSVLTFNFLNHLTALPFAFFDTRKSGDLIVRMNSNRSVRDILTSSTLSAVLDGGMILLALLMLLFGSVQLALLVLLLASLEIVVFGFTRRRYQDLHLEQLSAQGRAQSLQIQMLSGMESIKTCGQERVAGDRWGDAYVDELNVTLKQGRLQAWTDAIRDALGILAPLAFLVIGGFMVLAGQLSLGLLLAMSMLANNVLQPLKKLLDTGYDLARLKSYLQRIDDVFSSETERAGRAWNAPPRLTGEVRVEDLSFRYSASGPLVLKQVSFAVEPGGFVAIVGPSGSGKSTLARMLAGLYSPQSGRIVYDGHDLMDLDLESVRQQMGIVTQQPFLFDGSIREYIAFGDADAPLDKVVQAACAAAIHDDIEQLPRGYNTQIGDGSGGLSGGQRQRLAIARALFNLPSMLVLDEATSALDTVTEKRVYEHIKGLRQTTRIVIAHRLSTIRQADVIVVLNQGELVEMGTDEELMARPGMYRKLVSAQGVAVSGAWQPG